MKVSWDPCRLSACRTSSIGPLEWSNTQVTPRLPYHHETHSLTVLSLNVISRNHAFLPKRSGVVYVESRGRHGLIVVAFGVKRPWVDQCNHSANTDSQNHGARHAHCLRVSPRIYSALSKILETRKINSARIRGRVIPRQDIYLHLDGRGHISCDTPCLHVPASRGWIRNAYSSRRLNYTNEKLRARNESRKRDARLFY